MNKLIAENIQIDTSEFKAEHVKTVLDELLLTIENETDRMALQSDFTVDKNKIVFKFPNALMAERFAEYKAAFYQNISLASGSSDWQIDTEIATIETKAKIYKTQDKFEAMKQKNPMLNTFKEAFNLDLDF